MHKLRLAWTLLVLLLFSFYFGGCADNEPGAGTPCDHETSCEDGMVCIDGYCDTPDVPPDGTRTPNPTKNGPDSGNYTDECTSDKDCEKDLSCIQTVQDHAICTRRCPPDGGNEVCSKDSGDLLMECVGIRPDSGDIVHVCLPRPDTHCKVCQREDKDLTGVCGTSGLDLCRQQDDGDFRCAIACSNDLPCPEGSTCEQIQELNDDEPIVYDVCVPNTGYCQKCVDEDGDGYGNPAFDMSDCPVPDVPDCDDNDAGVNPGRVPQCNGKDDACQGRIDHDYRNEDGEYATLAHCGACDQPCELSHAVAQCDTGTCTFVECEPGWVNIHGDEDTVGCPYECTPQPEKGEDSPSDLRDPSQPGAAQDLNCDGIDGDASRALFVAKTGNDLNPGTRAQPLKTIGAALNALGAMSTSVDQIYVSRGDYSENLTLVDGVSIYGGFDVDQDWARSTNFEVRILGGHLDSGNRIGLKGRNLEGSGLTIVQNLTVRAQDATGYVTGTSHGASSYGVHCTNCPSLVLRGMTIEAGKAANGRSGIAGARPSDFRPSSCHGGHGEMAGSGKPANGPPGGESFQCNGPDGLSNVWTPAGGKGGDASNDMGGDGGNGAGNARAQAGGSGGEGVGPGCNSVADDGERGRDGLSGTQGTGGKQPTALTAAGFFVPQDGTSGSIGAAGTGGGGGGGGATHTATLPARRHSGGPGGAGGAGGCPGGGGSAGGSGGSSIALTLIDSPEVLIERVRLVASSAGNGAEGGAGGVGRQGCNGGKGDTGGTANKCSRAGGDGGNGAEGGHGGQGGTGGGGAGGSAIGAIFKNSSKSNGPATSYEAVVLPANAGERAGNGAVGLRMEERVFP